MESLIVFDSGSEERHPALSTAAMALEIATVLLGVSVGAIVVIYAVAKSYLGHKKTNSATPTPVTSIDNYLTTAEQVPEVPATAAPSVAESAPSPAPEPAPTAEAEPAPAPTPALYETVQPAPAPVTFAAPSSASFGAPTLTKKPTRTYRRRSAPVRSTIGPRKTLAKPKKR